MNRKLLSVVAIILVLIVTALAFVIFAEREKETAIPAAIPAMDKELPKIQAPEKIDTGDWKLYQNATYGYEMKYPSDWTITTKGLAPSESFSAPDFSLIGCFESEEGICPRFAIGNVHNVLPGETIETDINLNTNDRVIAKANIDIAGEDASFVEYFQSSYGRRDGGMGLVRQEMKMIHNGVMYRIYIDEYATDIERIKTSADWKYKATFEAMLASFRFLDSGQIKTVDTPKPAGIVYVNDTYGFRVSLPEGWEKYRASVQKDKGDDNHIYIYFLLPTADKNSSAYDKNTGKLIPGMADIFAITATDLKTWNKDISSTECQENPNPECPDESSVIGKNDKYVFTAHYGNGIVPADVQKFIVGNSAAKFLSGKFKLKD